MATWVNFAEVRARVSLEDVIYRFYKIENLTRTGSKLVGPCPVHNGDSPRAFHADLDRNIWHCFSRCQAGGNQIDFVARRENTSVRDAAIRLQAFFLSNQRDTAVAVPAAPPASSASTSVGAAAVSAAAPAPPARSSDGSSPPPSISAPAPPALDPKASPAVAVPERNPPLTVTLKVKHEYPYLLEERGLSLETLRLFDVGYCSRGIMKGLVTIPIHDKDGTLVAYAGRRLRHSDIATYGKYKFPKGFQKDLVLFNHHRAKEHAQSRGLILVEGFFAVLKLHEAGFQNVVAAMGCEVSERQAALLASASQLLVFFDGDDAGRRGAIAVRERLRAIAPALAVKTITLPEGQKPDTLSAKALRWVLNGIQALDFTEITLAMSERKTLNEPDHNERR